MQKGALAFYRFNGEASKGLSVDGVRVLDVLASGKQTVTPASIHPDTGAAYVWMTAATLEHATGSPANPIQRGFPRSTRPLPPETDHAGMATPRFLNPPVG